MQPCLKSAFSIVIVFIASFAIAFITMERKINVYDEGVVLAAALRVAAGDIIHRDFYANYGPAQFYLLSWLFKAFGQLLIVERVYDLLIRSGILAITFASTILYARRWIALVATFVCGLWLCAVGSRGYPMYPALLLALGSTLLLTHAFMRNTATWRLFAAGILTGLSALFRYDIGFFAFSAHLLSMALIFAVAGGGSNNFGQNILARVSLYILGAGLPVISIILWYWKVHALNFFLHDVLIFPSQYYARTRGLPFPTLSSFATSYSVVSLAVYMPLAVCFFAVLSILKARFSSFLKFKSGRIAESGNAQQVAFIIFLTFLVAVFYLKGVVRVSVEHFQLAILPSIMLFAVVFEAAIGEIKVFKNALVVLAILGIFDASAFGAIKLLSNNTLVIRDMNGFLNAIERSTAQVGSTVDLVNSHFRSPFLVDGSRSAAIRFIMQNTSQEQRIFVGLTRHDKIFVNDVSVYFLTDRLPATKWHHFDPGLQTSAEIQSEMVVDLESFKPLYIWLESTWDDVCEPNDSAISSGVRILDDYIDDKYQFSQAFGQVLIYKRRVI